MAAAQPNPWARPMLSVEIFTLADGATISLEPGGGRLAAVHQCQNHRKKTQLKIQNSGMFHLFSNSTAHGLKE